ncbi:hypothetical protein, partial [Streptosporangium sp. NPDC048865]|uniref:hypothetical protein n=1 Tax=Streptosporangium sp. NPDC048865 TaxID=3155766 RepID=UPI00342F4D54
AAAVCAILDSDGFAYCVDGRQITAFGRYGYCSRGVAGGGRAGGPAAGQGITVEGSSVMQVVMDTLTARPVTLACEPSRGTVTSHAAVERYIR